MQLTGLESRAVDGCSLMVSRETMEQRLQKLLDAREGFAEHAVLYIELDGDTDSNPDSETSKARAFLGMLPNDMVWTPSADDCITPIGHSEFVMLMALCPLSHALQTARLLRLWSRTGIATLYSCENPPGLSIGIAPALVGGEPRTILACAQNACRLAKLRGRGSICISRIETGSQTACTEREVSSDECRASDEGRGESRPYER